jgi:hypothetical protein
MAQKGQKDSNILDPASSTFALSVRWLAGGLAKGTDKLRSVQYHNAMSACALGAKHDTLYLHALLETIEKTGAGETLASRDTNTFGYKFHHVALALWALNDPSSSQRLKNNADCLLAHFCRVLHSPTKVC